MWDQEVDKHYEEISPKLVKKSGHFNKQYRITNKRYKTIEKFILANQQDVMYSLQKDTKVNYTLKMTLMKEDEGHLYTREHYLKKPAFVLLHEDDFEKSYKDLVKLFTERLMELETRESGWTLQSIDYLDINLVRYKPFKAGKRTTLLPKQLQKSRSILKMENDDDQCLKWAITSLVYPQPKNKHRVSKKLIEDSQQLIWKGIEFPSGLKDLKQFEKHNSTYLLYVYGRQDDEYFIVYKPDLTQTTKTILPLFFVHDHFFPIINITGFHRLLFKKKTHVCLECLTSYCSEKNLLEHQKYCQREYQTRIKMPRPNTTLKFSNYAALLKHPFVVYMDTESSLQDICEQNSYQKHVPYAFATLFLDTIANYSEYKTFDTSKDLLDYLDSLAREKLVAQDMNLEEQKKSDLAYTHATTCYFCQLPFTEENPKVRDHDHFTGKFRGIAHQRCNLNKLRKTLFLPVFAHNMMRYDEKTFIRDLQEGATIIAKNIENFVSFEYNVKGTEGNIRFLDSLKFLNGSLETLTKNLLDKGEHYFFHTRDHFKKHFSYLTRKGVFPYDYVTDKTVLDLTTSLPERKHFYSQLKEEDISEEDYTHAQTMWKMFECLTLRDYMNLYLKLDVCLLADIFEQFRCCIQKEYQLDPVYFLTLSSLAMQCALRYSNQELEIISDPTMYNFIESGIRGGVSMICKRYAKANNEQCTSYDPSQPKSYIFYVDSNNLYGQAMRMNLPIGQFRWEDPVLFDWESHDCILDVDVHCPPELFHTFQDYPLCPTHEQGKLVTTFYDKKGYICHSAYLKMILRQGYILTHIHKILSFASKPWLRGYIDKNSTLRAEATSTFEKDLWKTMNNSVYGKQIENVRKRANIRLEDEKNAEKLVARPHYRNIISLDQTYLIEMGKLSVTLNKPIYCGLAILDYSKIIMSNFMYDYLKPKFGDRYQLLFTDTDSFMGLVYSDDLYQEILPDLSRWFDTSNYPKDHFFPKLNKKVPGFFKDEMAGQCIERFVGLRAKQYAYQTKKKEELRCKGINKQALHHITFEDYLECLHEKQSKYTIMHTIRSRKHTNYTEKCRKKALDPFDTKRRILENGIDTVPWGM